MTFVRMLRKIKKEKNELKILFVGLDNAGKTTILHKHFQKPIERISPTFGYQIHTVPYHEKSLVILDVGGQDTLRKYWSNYFEKLDGIVFVYDISDERNFVEYLNMVIEENLDRSIPVLILANKCDIVSKNVSFENLMKYGALYKAFVVSGRTGENLEEAFDWFFAVIDAKEYDI